MKIRENIPISTLTTMRLGGPARYVIDVEKPEEIPEAYNFAKSKSLPTFILGGGANTIGHDEGFDGVIIKSNLKGIIEAGGAQYSFEGPKTRASAPERPEKEYERQAPLQITAFSGEEWDAVVAYACERGLTGIEALSKIPGLAGAAPVQNIGAYGQDISQTLVSIEVYDTLENKFKTLDKNDLQFSYRKSILNTTAKNRYFVISITLELKPGTMSHPFYNSIEKYIIANNCTDFSPAGVRDIVSKIRADKLPDPKEKASAGSFFKNVYLTEKEATEAEKKDYPVYRGHDGLKINSGWLIEQAGFSDQLIHGIRVNKKAALVLINESAKSYADLAAARQEIIDKIQKDFGYKLEQEPVEIWRF